MRNSRKIAENQPTPNTQRQARKPSIYIKNLNFKRHFWQPKKSVTKHQAQKNLQFTSRISKFSDISDAREIHDETDAYQMHFTSEWTPNTIHPMPNAKHKNLQFASRISLLSVNFDPQKIRGETDAYHIHFTSGRPAGRLAIFPVFEK